MVELSKEEIPLDEEFIRMRMAKRGEFDEVHMLDVMSATPTTMADVFIDTLVEMSKKRRLVTLATEIKKSTIEEDEDSSVIVGTVDKKLDDILNVGSKLNDKTASYYVEEMREDMRLAEVAGDIVGYKSGIHTLDAKIGAFQEGDLVVIAARPSMGKTSLVTTITDYAVSKGYGVLIDSLEMSGKKIMSRLVATRSEEPLVNIRRGQVSNPDKFNAAVKFYTNCTLLHIHEESYIPIHELKAKAVQKFRKNPEIKYWFIDHLRYIKKPGINIPNEINEITKELRRVAKQYGIVVFLLSQLNRANEQRTNKRAMLSDLRESGAIEEDADIIIFPHRESYYQRNIDQKEPIVSEAELNIGKNRDGEAGICKCYFRGTTTAFENYGAVEYEYADSLGHVDMPTL
jgi:replicative DNA helicase